MTFEPTATTKHDPSVCNVCGRHAVGIGIGDAGKDPRYLCRECVTLIERIRSVRRWDPYEIKARQGGMDAAGEVIERYGSDLGEYSEDQALELVGAIWRGCADELHRVLENREAPF